MNRYFFLLAAALFFSRCGDTPEPDNKPNLRALSQAEQELSRANNDLGFRLLQDLRKDNPENVFISPLSVSTALSMLLNGAEGDVESSILNTIEVGGLTSDQVNEASKALTGLLLGMDRKIELGIANSIWHDLNYPIHDTFASIIRNYYDGEVSGEDFSAASTTDKINNWVEDKTNGRIKDLLNEISPDEIAYLINAIYFKGEWTYQFDPAKTHIAPFHNIDGASQEVNMMMSTGAVVRYLADSHVTLIDIPYGNEQFRFTVVMPSQPDEFVQVADGISADQLQAWLNDADSVSVQLELPRFKLEWKKDLKATLESMGMKMAGFPKMFKEPVGVQVSKVIHQSFLEVNEKGSEAAAATAIGLELTSAPPQPFRVTVDKPFLFMIREKHSGLILFMGQFTDGSVAR